MASSRMIVPAFWAEARLHQRIGRKQLTVRRWGWSDTSQNEAQHHADTRAEEALQRLLSGEKLQRREPKVAYNGAHGVPIREEVISRQGDAVVTRNAYGARCLNTPNVVFADIDFAPEGYFSGKNFFIACAMIIASAVTMGMLLHSVRVVVIIMLAGMLFSIHLALWLSRVMLKAKGGAHAAARKKIEEFLKQHPQWGMRLYQTPAGMRILVTHSTFDPEDTAVLKFFKAIGTDKIYQRMCMNQQCFRARVSAKPWRAGISNHMPGSWPPTPDRAQLREAWVTLYESRAEHYAACRYIGMMGGGIIHPDVLPVQQWHDDLCRATSNQPIA